MSRSSKIILASCVCAAFLAVGISCTVEDRDVEEKDVFLCKSDADCLDSSQCVKAHEKGTPEYAEEVGRCVRDDEIDHCRDNDGDGYYIAMEGTTADECGFSDANPADLDDADALVYPGAPELCDGKDNSGDGCVDGVMTNNQCEPIQNPCWGAGKVANYDKSVCSAALIGYEKCEGGKMVYVAPTGSSTYNLGKCPTDASQIPNYTENETCGNGIDDNCNTKVDEGCVNCESKRAETPYCYVTSDSSYAVEKVKNTNDVNYKLVVAACNEAGEGDCACIGESYCEDENSELTCRHNGTKITQSTISGKACETTFNN